MKECIRGIIGGKVIKEVTDVAELYDESYFSDHNFKNQGYKKLLFERLDWVKEFINIGRLLDVGCATGAFLKIAQNEGFDVYGVDFSSYAIEEAKKNIGENVTCINIENQEFPYEKKFFDAITMFDLVEHLNNPYNIFGKIEKMMRVGGVLFIVTQNYNSISRKIYGKRWYGFAPAYHLTPAITPDRLKRSLEKNNFKVITLYTKFYPSFMVPAIIDDFPRVIQIAINGCFFMLNSLNRLFLHRLHFKRFMNFGDYMFCVAKKLNKCEMIK